MEELENFVKVQDFMSKEDYIECINIFKNIDNNKNKTLQELEDKNKLIEEHKIYTKQLEGIYLHPIKKGAF